MSGHSGFMPIRGAQQANVNVINEMHVDNNVQIAQADAPKTKPEAELHAAAEKSFNATSLVKELDVLLAKAASKARIGTSGEDLAKIAGKAKLDAETAAALKKAAITANKTMRKLDGFTGAALAKAMVKKDGGINWDEGNPAGEAIKEAMDAQEKLSDMLNKAINRLPKKASAAVQAALEEAMLQADRRMGEVETIVMQIIEIAEIGLDNGNVDFETEARLNRTMGELAGEKALAMHDNDRALKSMKDNLAPLIARIDAYAANATAKVSSGELKTFVREITAAKNAIANAAKTGIVKVPNGEGAMVDVFVDRTFLDAAAKIVEDAAQKLGNLRESVGLEATRKFIDNDMPWLKDPLFAPSLSKELRELFPDKFGALSSLAAGLGNLRNAMLAVVDSPGEATAGRLRIVGCSISYDLISRAVKELTDNIIARNPPPANASEAFKKAYNAFIAKCAADKNYVKDLCGFIKSRLYGINAAVEHVITMAWKAHSLKDQSYRSSGALLGVFRGDRNFTSLVESRVHGYGDGDINAALDDVNVDDSKVLGSGKFNTVTLVKFKNGSEYVFKPEMAGRLGTDSSPLQVGMDDEQQLTRINGAVQKTADALGLGDVMVKTTAGTHKGSFGMFMEKAPGVTAANFREGVEDKSGEAILDKEAIKNLSDADYEKVVGRMMRQCNRLQWFDVITGQGDRHGNNYMVQVGADLTVTVKGIDNDASFGIFRIGLRKFHITDEDAINRFNKELSLYVNSFKGSEQAVYDELQNDPGIEDAGNGIVVDLAKIKSPALAYITRCALGAKALAVPKDIDKDLYDSLIALRGGAARRAHLNNLKARLGDGTTQYNAAVKRLDDAILYAMKLNEAGRVYTKEQWETKEIQRTVMSHQTKFEAKELDGQATIQNDNVKNYYIARVASTLTNNLFFRDIEKGISRPGWFDPQGNLA